MKKFVHEEMKFCVGVNYCTMVSDTVKVLTAIP